MKKLKFLAQTHEKTHVNIEKGTRMSLEMQNDTLVAVKRFAEGQVMKEVPLVAGFVDGEFIVCDPFTSDEEFVEWHARETGAGGLPKWISVAKSRAHFLSNVVAINQAFSEASERGELEEFIAAVLAAQ